MPSAYHTQLENKSQNVLPSVCVCPIPRQSIAFRMLPVVSLHNAARNGNREVVNLLLDWDTNIHAVNTYGETALFCATIAGHSETVQVLVEKGADIQCVTTDGLTPILGAAQHGPGITGRPVIFETAHIGSIQTNRSVSKVYGITLCFGLFLLILTLPSACVMLARVKISIIQSCLARARICGATPPGPRRPCPRRGSEWMDRLASGDMAGAFRVIQMLLCWCWSHTV